LLAEGIAPPDASEWKEWNAAIDEDFALERKAKGTVGRHRFSVAAPCLWD